MTTTPAPTKDARVQLVVATLAFGGIVAAIMQTLVVPLIGDLPTMLHTDPSNATWVITATLLSAAVATPVAGRLGDMIGKRRMLLISTIPLVAGSVLCALASSLAPMIVGRGLQGIGMGIVPLGISLLRDVVPTERLASSIAVISASMGVGGALGLPFAASVAQGASWRVLFWVSAGLGAVVALLVWRVVPTGRQGTGRARFDVVGALGLGVGLVALLLAVSKGADWGWGSATTVTLFVVAVVVLLAWGWWELRTTDPLVDLRVTARPQVLATNGASVLVGFAMYAQSLVIPQLMQLPTSTGYGLGQSMIQMGLWMAPSGLMMMAVAPFGAKISDARGPKVTLALGAFVIAAGYAASVLLLGSTVGALVVTLVCSAGVGLAYGAMPALIMGAVPREETASANAFNTLMRSIGSSTAAAVMGLVLAQMTTDLGGGHVIPSEAGFHTAMLVGAGVALVAGVVAVLIPVRRAASGAPTRPHATAGVDAPETEPEGVVAR